MKFKLLLMCVAISYSIYAQENDSIRVVKNIKQVNINDLRATDETPMSYTNIKREQIEEQNLGQDVPYLLSLTPSVVTNSDAGAGIGYTSLRVRGSDATRINVTIDGIPLNDSESQGVWWVNMPDFSSSIEDIQIQRGVGTSTNGAGAFGASINLKTMTLNPKAYAISSNTFGSYNTLKNNLSFGTGLLEGKFTLDGRLSKITSDGYIDRATSDLKSYFLTAAYYGENDVLKVNVISGKERTYQAWNGVPFNYLAIDSLRTYNSYTYKNEVDNYNQDHYVMHYNKQIDLSTSFKLGLHYTKGQGYYEQYKIDEDFTGYNLNNLIIGTDTVTSTNLVRRKWLDNDFYGTIFSIQEKSEKLNLTIGGGWNKYEGRHFGEIIWAQYASNSELGHIYYDNDAEKTDFNIYVKALYDLNNQITTYLDIQKRFIRHSFLGIDEDRIAMNDKVKFNFFNPKFGLFYEVDKNQSAFGSFAIANREPNRADFIESSPSSRPKHETLYDTELGYNYTSSKLSFSANAYYMIYDNQLVVTGKINDVGAYTRENVEYSERKGVELVVGYQINDDLKWNANATFSKNKILKFTEYVDNWDTGNQEMIVYENTDIAFSPKVIASSAFDYKLLSNTNIQLLSKYVGNQYIDNTSSKNRMLNRYVVHNLRLMYSFHNTIFKTAKLTFQVNNILNESYTNNAWIYRFISEGYDPRPDDPYVNSNSTGGYDMAGYFPQAKRNFLLGLTLGF